MTENTGTPPTEPERPRNPQADGPSSAAVLRTMEAESDRLAEEIDEARQAVQAALRADSMALPGDEDIEAVDKAPGHGAAPVDPHDDEGEPERS